MNKPVSASEITPKAADRIVPKSNLVAALAAAQAQMHNAGFNRTNPHFKNKYADLAAIRDATMPALSANGLVLVQFTSMDMEGGFLLHTRIAHESGEYIESVYPLPVALDKPQVMGSALTYAKRYSWAAMCGISAEEDDDGNAVEGANGGAKATGPISEAQRAELEKLAAEVKIDTVKFYEWLGITAMADLPAAYFIKAKTALESKRKK